MSAGFSAYYTLALRDDDAGTVQKVADYFRCGNIHDKKSKTHPQKKFAVASLEDLLTCVVPHFERFPLQSRKACDYEAWKQVLHFVSAHLYGRKRWVENYSTELDQLRTLCGQVRAARAYPEAGLVLQ